MNENNKPEETNVVNLEEEFGMNGEEEPEEAEVDLSDYAQEQLEEFQAEVAHLKVKHGEEFVQKLNTELLDPEDHTLWKLYRKFDKEGWPSVRRTSFARKLRQYDLNVIQPLSQQSGTASTVEAKEYFIKFLKNELEQAETMSQAA
jgi:hypothetical protein